MKCLICKTKIPKGYKKFCSKKCRTKSYNLKNREYQKAWIKERQDKEATKSQGKVQCLICEKWYVQVGSHIVQTHKMTCREYRQEYGLEVKRGITPSWYRKLKGDQALTNGTYKNLQAGAKHRFKKGDAKAGRYERSPITKAKLIKQITHPCVRCKRNCTGKDLWRLGYDKITCPQNNT